MAGKSVNPELYTYDVITRPTLRDLAWSRNTLNEREPAQVVFTLFNRCRMEQTEVSGVVTEISYAGNYALVKLLDEIRELWEINFHFRGPYEGIGTAFNAAEMFAANAPQP